MTDAPDDARFWDRAARKYAAEPIADLAGYERTLERTRAYMDGKQAVFEFGCGTGTTALRLAPAAARYVASDVSQEMILIAREKAEAQLASNLDFVVATADGGFWGDRRFDLVLGFNILHLVRDRPRTFAAARALLRPGGLFISKTPCLREMNPLIRWALPLARALGKAPYVDVFDAKTLEREIEAAGFEIVERARHGAKGKDPRIFIVARRL